MVPRVSAPHIADLRHPAGGVIVRYAVPLASILVADGGGVGADFLAADNESGSWYRANHDHRISSTLGRWTGKGCQRCAPPGGIVNR